MADQQHPQLQQEEMNFVHAAGLDSPLGYCFHPSDNEIVSHYLTKKVHNPDFTCTAIGEVDLNKIEPWDLPNEAKWGGKEWYFFYQKDRKYPTGPRVNRATEAGYWKSTGNEKEVYNTTEGVLVLVGMKRTLVFYKGRAPRGDKTNWVMHEYRLEGSGRLPGPASTSSSATTAMKASASSSKDEWVVCRVFHKTTRIKKRAAPAYQVAMADAEIYQNQNNIMPIPVPVPIPIPMPLQLPLPVPMPMQFPILPDFAMDPTAPYFPNAGFGMPPMMPLMAGIGGTGGLQINGALFDNPIVMPPHMNFYNQMGLGAAAGQMDMGIAVGPVGMGVAVAQMDMGAAGDGGFDGGAPESSLSSMVLQKDEEANAVDISSIMSATGTGSATTTIEMNGMWQYNY